MSEQECKSGKAKSSEMSRDSVLLSMLTAVDFRLSVRTDLNHARIQLISFLAVAPTACYSAGSQIALVRGRQQLTLRA